MMSRKRTQLVALATLLVAVSTAWAEGQKVRQGWTPPRAAHNARVVSCSDSTPLPRVAMDDWICEATGPIVRVKWWDVVFAQEQLNNRPFYVAVWSHDSVNCRPASELYGVCVTPRVRQVGTDCNGNAVYRFSARLIPPFQQTAGEHYWLGISEADEESARPNVIDFRWSAHRPIRHCDAVARDAGGTYYQPITDACDGNPNDLAFALTSRAIAGTITLPPGFDGYTVFLAQLRDVQTGDLLESLSIMPCDDGFFEVWPEYTSGDFLLELHGMGALPLRATITLESGTETLIDFPDWYRGDLNADDEINLPDLATLLGNYGMP